MHLLEPGHLEEDCPIKMVSVNKRLSSFLANWPVMFIKLILSAQFLESSGSSNSNSCIVEP